MNFDKLIDDTLKEKDGKWSRKSLTMFVCMAMSVITGTYIVFSNVIIDRPVAEAAEVVFLGFLAGAWGNAYLTVRDKNNIMKIENNQEEPLR
jgi:hypothetical protein